MSGTASDLTTLNEQLADAKALTSGSYTITLDADIAYSSAILPIALASGVSLTIDGDGHALNSSGAAPGLQVLGGTVTVNDLTISGAIAQGDNGAIGGGGGGAGLGGGLFVGPEANVTIRGVSFSSNEAIGGGGGDGAPTPPLPSDATGKAGTAGLKGTPGHGPATVQAGVPSPIGGGGGEGRTGGTGGNGGVGGKGASGGSGGFGVDGIGTGGNGGDGGIGGHGGGIGLVASFGFGGGGGLGGSPYVPNDAQGADGGNGEDGGNSIAGATGKNGDGGSDTGGFGGGGGGGGEGGGGGGGGGGGSGRGIPANFYGGGSAGLGGLAGLGGDGGTGSAGGGEDDESDGGSGGQGGFGAGSGGDGAGGSAGKPGTPGGNGTAGTAGNPGQQGSPGSGGTGGNGGNAGNGGTGGDGGAGGAGGGGGGGLGAGGDIFVAHGGQLIIEGGSLSGGKVLGGAGGSADASAASPASAGDAGSAFGAGIFIMGTASISLGAPLGQSLTISDQISDQSGSDPSDMFEAPAAGSLIINGPGTVDLNAANEFVGGTTIESGALAFGASGAAGSGPIAFAGPAELQLNFAAHAVPSNTISGFAPGDAIVIDGFVETGVGYGSAGLILTGANATAATLDIPGLSLGDFVVTPNAGSDLTTVAVTCFAAGTRIATENGEVAVEALKAGDRVMLYDGHLAPVVWLGRRRVDCTRHPIPTSVWPVRVAADAFASGLPRRDLYLSPDHALFTADVLIPVKYLINGSSIAQVPVSEVIYFHVELPAHDVLIAEGLHAESYLDAGGRASFENAGGAIALHPGFPVRVWDGMGCAPLIVTGAKLATVRQWLDARAPGPRRDAAVA